MVKCRWLVMEELLAVRFDGGFGRASRVSLIFGAYTYRVFWMLRAYMFWMLRTLKAVDVNVLEVEDIQHHQR